MKLLKRAQLSIVKDFSFEVHRLNYFKTYTQSSIAAKNRQRNNNRKMAQPKRFSESELEVTAQRILSARKHQISNQSNIIQELQKQIESLQTENKILKTQTHRQEKALQKIDGKQSDLPRILEQHQSEISNLKEQMRRTKDILTNEMRQRKECDNEITKLRTTLSKANQLVSDRNLGERSVLQMQLIETQGNLESSEKSLETANKYLENLEKSHRREIHNLKKQLKKFEFQHSELEKELENLKINLREKEKLLEIQNIYSHRFKIPHRLPNTSNDLSICGACSALNNDQLLDKLHFNHINTKENSVSKNVHQSNPIDDSTNMTTYLDPEKIKDDIRKILEEEIMSGRIKPIEYQSKDHYTIISNGYQSPEKESPLLGESCDTSRVMGSDIFDPVTQIQSLAEDIEKPEAIHHHIEQDFKRKEILLEKLRTIDQQEQVVEEVERKTPLKYSYPNDNDFVKNDPSFNEIETISASENKVATTTNKQSYTFNNAVEHLHQGIPIHINNNDANFKRRLSDKNKIPAPNKKESVNLLTDLVLSQKNNSNSDSLNEEPLPPLSETGHQNKEHELMVELFGQYQQSNSASKNRIANLPWTSNDFAKPRFDNGPHNVRPMDLRRSEEELEEIQL